MRLRAWALSSDNDGARSTANWRFLDVLLCRGSFAATPGATISHDETTVEGIHCIRLRFNLPQACQSNGVVSIAVLLPSVCIRNPIYQPTVIFYALIEETIGWLTGVGPAHTLVRQLNNHGQPLACSYSSSWRQLHDGFALFITSLRNSNHRFSGLGQMSGSLGVLETVQARTPSGDVSEDYIVTITLANGQKMALFLPRAVALLPKEWMLDWLEVRNEFSPQAV